MGTNAETLPASLTERRFRHFWEQTASPHRLARRLDLDLRRLAAPVLRKPVLMCVKLSGGKAASSNVFLASVGARLDKM